MGIIDWSPLLPANCGRLSVFLLGTGGPLVVAAGGFFFSFPLFVATAATAAVAAAGKAFALVSPQLPVPLQLRPASSLSLLPLRSSAHPLPSKRGDRSFLW